MRAWYLSEAAYSHLPPDDEYESIRIDLPSKLCEPTVAAALWDQYLAEWQIAEDEGLDIMINEHHATATCMNSAGPVLAAALSRTTRKARILLLGNPIANRRQPVRVAEEMALCDILTHGRLEVGFVRGVLAELLPANSNPVYSSERHWEALDLIVKCWTTHDGPFSHEGRFFHHRSINIWPRPYQLPHPPVWVSTTSPAGATQIAARGHIAATFVTGLEETPKIFGAYKKAWVAAGNGQTLPVGRLAYSCLVYTAENEAQAWAGAEKLMMFLRAGKMHERFRCTPGFTAPQAAVASMRSNYGAAPRSTFKNYAADVAQKNAVLFVGTPDQVFDQIAGFYRAVGGFGHLLLVGQSGYLEHDEAVRGIRCFARDVYPRLKEAFPDDAAFIEAAEPVPA